MIGYPGGALGRLGLTFFMLAWKHLRIVLPRRKPETGAACDARDPPLGCAHAPAFNVKPIDVAPVCAITCVVTPIVKSEE
jgi:hypothetical protein